MRTKRGTDWLVFILLLLLVWSFMARIHPRIQRTGMLRPAGDGGGPDRGVAEIEQTYLIEDGQGLPHEVSFTFSEAVLEEALYSFGVAANRRNNQTFLLRGGFRLVERKMRQNPLGELIEEVRLRIDYESIFADSKERFRERALHLHRSLFSELTDDPLQPFLKFVQSLPYSQPPDVYKGRYINGFFVPTLCLASGYGDCDSKALMLAELLALSHEGEGGLGLALISGEGISHSVLLVQRPQLPGMSSIFTGDFERYLPVETTAPGWVPGFLSPVLIDLLKAGRFTFVSLE